tara:strand:- start:59 stop:748 length:690 start_codon:yes stop_codon:yes gene_type:complete
MAAEFLEPELNWDTHCGDQPTFGRFSTMFDYPTKAITQASSYPPEACQPWLHYNMRLGNLAVDTNIQAGGVVTAPRFQGTINVQSWKGFDIKHPNKLNHRLRHICLEGPEAGVYYRGRLTGKNTIELPSYWEGLIDVDSITVTLTQIGSSQDLIVESIDWGKVVKVKSGNGTGIDCYYVIQAARIDGEPLIVEYEGETPAEYPGDDKQFSISGYDYDARGDKSTKETNQ